MGQEMNRIYEAAGTNAIEAFFQKMEERKRGASMDPQEEDVDFLEAVEAACREVETKRVRRAFPIDGLDLRLDFVSLGEERALMEAVDNSPWNTSLSRRTQHYGYLYDYKSRSAASKTTPIPGWSESIRSRLTEQGLLTTSPDQLIVNEYKPGQGIAAHVDSGVFADGIVSVSLGSDVVMEFTDTQSTEKVSLCLPRRSALILHGDARYRWKHCIPPRKTDNMIPRLRRISLTFRVMKQK